MGLLDGGFFATSEDDPRYAQNMAFFQGIANKNVPGALLAQKQDQMKQGLLQAQLENYKSEIEARKLATIKDQRLQDAVDKLLSGGGAPSQPAQPGQFGSGSFGAIPAAQGQTDMPAPQAQGSRIGNASPDLIAALALQGKDLTNLWKTAKEGFERKPGSFYEDMQGRRQFIPDPKTGMDFQNGRVNMLPGFADFTTQNTLATEGPKALLNAAGTLNLRKNSDGTETPVSALTENPTLQNVLGSLFNRGPQSMPQQPLPPQAMPPRAGASEASLRPQIAGDMGPDPAALAREIQQTQAGLQNPSLDPQSRQLLTAHLADMTKQQQALPPSQGMAPRYGQTVEQQNAAAAGKVTAEDLARGQAERDNTNLNKGVQFKDFRDQMNMARTLLKAGPTHSLVGAGVDSLANVFGQSTSGAEIAKQLDLVGGWMTQNIPKAPGAQSNYELSQYQNSAGNVGDKTLPIQQRLKALDSLEGLLNTWEARRANAGQTGAAGGATGSWGGQQQPAEQPKATGQTFDKMPPANPANKGRTITDTTTGAKYVSNGFTWQEMK